jgi:hypothetical protein
VLCIEKRDDWDEDGVRTGLEETTIGDDCCLVGDARGEELVR